MTVHRLKLLQASWQPKILQVLVAQVAKGLISREEGAYAMRLQVVVFSFSYPLCHEESLLLLLLLLLLF
jgi:hypothetical protein